MSIRSTVVIAGLFMVVIVYGRWRLRINAWLRKAGAWLFGFLFHSKTYKVAETFCNEVAVLWFVFPLIDSLYEHKSLTDPFLRHAYGVAGLFFFFAIVLSHAGGD